MDVRDNREALLLKFDIWLKASGDSVAGLIDVQDPDVDRGKYPAGTLWKRSFQPSSAPLYF